MDNKSLGENIARKRKQNNLTQEQLAEKMNVSSQAVSKWENDLSNPDVETLNRLAALFECSLDELVNGSPASPIIKSSEPEMVDRRTLTITVEANRNDSNGGAKIALRFPVVLIKRAMESGALYELVGNHSESIKQILPMILEGAVGELVNVQDANSIVRIAVEDYER